MKPPLKIHTPATILTVSIILLSFVAGVYFYSVFPEQVASHWSFNGEVDGYSSKLLGAFMIPIMITGLSVLFYILPALDPNKSRYPEFEGVYSQFIVILTTLLFIIYLAVGLFNIGYPIQIGVLIPVLIGLFLMYIGNLMGKIKPNWFMGIRTPWTLSSDVVWNKTHRVGGYVFILLGLITLISPFLGQTFGFALFMSGIALSVFGTFIYSYFIYRQEQKKQ